jgi:hypothetical protein
VFIDEKKIVDSEDITLIKNEKYYGEKPKIEGIFFDYIDDKEKNHHKRDIHILDSEIKSERAETIPNSKFILVH